MKVYYFTQVLKQGITIKTMCHNYILEFGNTNSIDVYLDYLNTLYALYNSYSELSFLEI